MQKHRVLDYPRQGVRRSHCDESINGYTANECVNLTAYWLAVTPLPPASTRQVTLTLGIGNLMHGHCLCGHVEFEIVGERFKLYQCHCSLCRRQGGSLSNAATIVPNEKFRWLSGAELISSWKKDSGFRSDFCSTCSSPVPNPLRNLPYFWVPAGLLEGNGSIEVVAHLCVASKAAWDSTLLQGACFDELPPNLSEFISFLQATDA